MSQKNKEGDPTYAAKIDKSEYKLDLNLGADNLNRVIRLGKAWVWFRGKRLGITNAEVLEGSGPISELGHKSAIGELSNTVVGTGDGFLELIEVKPEGKRAMPASDWIRGAQINPGDILE